jgi:meso-butanediol dehydrogenase / (S,S)-butanediol dehydrogenase / diacetyl reductase
MISAAGELANRSSKAETGKENFMSGIKNKVVVITGAGAGIGRACASVFAREGARVVVADIDLPGAQETVAQIEAAGGNALAVETDVSSPASVQNLVQKTIGALARIHVILNNAAIQVNKTVEETTVEE